MIPRGAVAHLKKGDPKLARAIREAGPVDFRALESPSPFGALADSIIAQQLAAKAAKTIIDRFHALFAPLQPEALALLALEPERLRSVGLSKQKLDYLLTLSRRCAEGELNPEGLADLGDEAVIEALTQVKGIGLWTAHMFLIFYLRRPDILPTGDLAIRAAMRRLFDLPDLPKPIEMETLSLAWKPWRSVACLYLWKWGKLN